MSWLGKVLGGTFGFLLGGPLGAILGASVGHHFDKGLQGFDNDEALSPGDQHRVQMAFFTATFSVMGHVAKADGRVSTEEINLAKRIMDELALSPEMRKTAINLFQQGKQDDFPLDDILHQFRKECHRRTSLMRMFLELQVQAAYADGALDTVEDNLLRHICSQLGIMRLEYESIKIQIQAQHRFYSQTEGQASRTSSRHQLNDAYAILDIKPSASDVEVKKAYRRLISQHHPDKLVSKGLPEEMMVLAKEKTQNIRKAYETIQNARKQGG